MIYQELIIDGISVDLPQDTDITLEITSNIFNDITEIVTNRSYTIALPKSVRNLTLLGNCDKVGIDSSVPYVFHTCEYRRNGVPIIRNGRATITECEGDISVNIYWGLFPFLEKLIEENKNLNELSSDLHVLFKRNNDISKYDDLQANGYGYADYNPYKYADTEDDWSSGSYVQAETKTTNYELVDGKIYTGTEVGDTSSGGIIEDSTYNCLVTDFTVGMKAQINNVVGLGEYRAYAILDSSGNVIEIADETTTSGTSKGDLNESSRSVDSRTNYFYPRIKTAFHVDKIEVLINGNGNRTNIEYGFIDANTNEVEVLGTISVASAINDTITTIDVNADKSSGQYVYIRQTDSSKPVLMGYWDYTGNSDLGRYNEDTDLATDVTNYNICFKIYYTSTRYVPETFKLSAPALAAKLVVNNNIVYSTEASVIVTSSGTSYVPQSAWGVQNALQPVVTCWWVLQQIMSDYGLTISFDNTDAESEIRGLALPLVTRDADAVTLTGGIDATMVSQTKLGTITIDVKSLPASFKQVTGEVTELTVETDCTLQFDIQAHCEWLEDSTPSGTVTSGFGEQIIKENYWWTYADYIKMTVTHSVSSGEDPDEYIIGPQNYDSAVRITESQLVNRMYTSLIVGAGKLDLNEGDTITFQLMNSGGTHNQLRMYDGTITAQLADSDEVPYGGQYPIVKNLGDISITDYIKTLNLLSGTFPLQHFDNNTVEMATYNELWDNKSKAVDWSNKLIANGTNNKPRQIAYSVDGYYQHNYYKWKEDDETKGNYDHDMRIDNPTLEDENDAFEFPFAASNGDRVPLYTPISGLSGSFAGSKTDSTTTDTTSSGGEYSACEPRIMNIIKSSDGKAALDFQINLDDIFDKKYNNLMKVIAKACVITEYLYLSDLEIMNFDERIPVYLAQYGAYFAVLSIKVSSDGYSEVELIKL